MGFEWVPGEGACEQRLGEMRRMASMPSQPMGEAWFMGKKRRLYYELCEDLNTVPVFTIQNALEELASGLSTFGPLADDWIAWCDYLVPRLVPRCDERYASWLLEELCSAALQADFGRDEAEQGRRRDVLETLGRSIMDGAKWRDGKIVLGQVLHPTDEYPSSLWGWSHVSGDLAASMMLCARLIQTDEIDGWVRSIFDISCPFWRAQILIWYLGARPFLSGKVEFPSELDDWAPRISWSGSHVLSGLYAEQRVATSFLGDERRASLSASFEAVLESAGLDLWLTEILAIDALKREVGDQLVCGFSRGAGLA